MFLLYRVLFCNFANNVNFVKIFLGLISCKCCNIVFFLYLLYVVVIFFLHVNVSIVIRSVVTK